MMLTLEKVLILHTVGIFASTPEDLLAEIAAVAEEVPVEAGEQILTKGETGDAMYVIVQGVVKIHDGERNLAEMKERQVFGELAALEPEARTADATSLTDCLLLRITREPLYRIMEANIQVTEGIVRVLVTRIREMSQQLHAKK